MKKLKLLSVMLLSMIMLSGCYTQSVKVSDYSGETYVGDSGSKFYFFWGAGQGDDIYNADAACNGVENVASIDTQTSIAGAAVGYITAPIGFIITIIPAIFTLGYFWLVVNPYDFATGVQYKVHCQGTA